MQEIGKFDVTVNATSNGLEKYMTSTMNKNFDLLTTYNL